MEAMVKKFQGKFRKVREQLNRWDELQSCLVSQFRNASNTIDRVQVLQNPNSYGGLRCDNDVRDALVVNQIKSLDNILVSMRSTLKEFHQIVLFLEKTHRDGRQVVKGSSSRPNVKQLQQRVGIKPNLIDCLDGLLFLRDIHHSEYLLKSAIISELSAIALKPRLSDLGALQQLLVDQPNLLSEEAAAYCHWLSSTPEAQNEYHRNEQSSYTLVASNPISSTTPSSNQVLPTPNNTIHSYSVEDNEESQSPSRTPLRLNTIPINVEVQIKED